MVMVTRSARRRACEVFDDNSSDATCNMPPWCSSGRPDERKKPREIPSTCEMRSSLVSPKNVWSFPNKNKSVTNSSSFFKRKIKSCREKHAKETRKCGALLLVLIILTVALGAILSQQILRKLSTTSTSELLSLMRINKAVTALDEECCYKMKLLSAALLKAEQTLRRTRRQHTLQLTAQSAKVDTRTELEERDFIAGATAKAGSGTEEWGGRATLWGVVPLWRTSPPPSTLLSLRKPTPADCWPFSGSRGEVIIELPQRLRLRSISVEHVRPDAARSAPRHFVLYGIMENSTWIKILTGEYMYDGPPKQFYTLLDVPPVNRVVFRVLSNHGNARYTCVYRVHVYEKDRSNVNSNTTVKQ